MSEADKKRLRRVLEGFFASRGLMKHLTADALVLWLDALSDLSVDEIHAGIRRFTKYSSEFPTPAAIRKYAGNGALNNDDRARIAWQVALEALGRYGHYESVCFDDPIINATIREMGGWMDFGGWESRQSVWKEKEFRERYEAIARIGRGDGSRLVGAYEAHNGLGKQETVNIECNMPRHDAYAALEYRGSKGIQQREAVVAGLLPDFSVEP